MPLYRIDWDDTGRALIEAENARSAMDLGNAWREREAGSWASQIHTARPATEADLRLPRVGSDS